MRFVQSVTITLLILFTTAVPAKTPDQLREEFMQELIHQHGFDPQGLKRTLWQARLRKPILEAIARPAEKRLTWGEYRKIFIQPQRIDGGVRFWNEHQALLQRAEAAYGVPPEIVVAIIGVETRYGAHTGKYPVLDALHTLGFHYPPRGKFFRSELKHFLLLAREENLDATRPLGSYAGAMGQPQFIPSSYRSYAVDFDGDGKRDIWHNEADIIGSVANYFARHGWRQGEEVTMRASGVGSAHQQLLEAGSKPSIAVAALRQSGIQPERALPADSTVSLFSLRAEEGTEHWLGLHNFYVITRYNHSKLYAMAVYQLSQAIRQQREQASASSQG